MQRPSSVIAAVGKQQDWDEITAKSQTKSLMFGHAKCLETADIKLLSASWTDNEAKHWFGKAMPNKAHQGGLKWWFETMNLTVVVESGPVISTRSPSKKGHRHFTCIHTFDSWYWANTAYTCVAWSAADNQINQHPIKANILNETLSY